MSESNEILLLRMRLNLVIVHVPKRENPIVNRLNKTKIVREVDHEQERVDRIKEETAVRRAAAAAKVPFTVPDLHLVFGWRYQPSLVFVSEKSRR